MAASKSYPRSARAGSMGEQFCLWGFLKVRLKEDTREIEGLSRDMEGYRCIYTYIYYIYIYIHMN